MNRAERSMKLGNSEPQVRRVDTFMIALMKKLEEENGRLRKMYVEDDLKADAVEEEIYWGRLAARNYHASREAQRE